jgi:hypothetical protein
MQSLRRGRARHAAGLVIGVVAATGCATSHVSDLDAYEVIPMSRVVPYPSPEELRKRAFEIVIVDRPSVGIDEKTLEAPHAQVRRALERIAAQSGATIIDRSLQEPSWTPSEGILSGLEGLDADAVRGADYALADRFSTYGYSATWRKPFKFLWQSEEDVAGKPGTCDHRVEVGLDVQVIDIGKNDHVEKTFALEHSGEQSNEDLDPACTIAPVTLSVLYETALDQALSCLALPLGAMLAPRGHVTEHRKAPEAERHIYRISLGSDQGIEHEDTVEIRREQRSTTPDGQETRSERVIALGRVTDQVTANASWVAVDPAKATTEILAGDVVRPYESEGLLDSLSGPDCGAILEAR